MSHSPHLFAHIQASYGMHPPGIDAPAEIPTAVIQEILAERQARDEALRELNDEYEARVAQEQQQAEQERLEALVDSTEASDDLPWWAQLVDKVPNEVWAGLQVVGGVSQVAGGVVIGFTTGWTFVGGIAAVAVAARGIDDIQAGIRSWNSGQQEETFTHSLGMSLFGGNRLAAGIFDAATGMIGPGGALRSLLLLRAGKTAANTGTIAQVARVAPRGLLQAPTWVKGGRTFVSWMKQLEAARPTLTVAQVDDLVAQARRYGVKVSAHAGDLAGHPGTNWPSPHIHFGDARIHVPVPSGYVLPSP